MHDSKLVSLEIPSTKYTFKSAEKRPLNLAIHSRPPLLSQTLLTFPRRARIGKMSQKVSAGRYYAEYHGHKVKDLERVHSNFRELNPEAPVAFLAGDSSLDNKHWFFDLGTSKYNQLEEESFTAVAVNGYEKFLDPPRMVCDVAYWMNRLCANRLGAEKLFVINSAVEESRVASRKRDLMPQDKFIRDHITSKDMLFLSVGGNDIALAPTPATISNMASLICMPSFLLKMGFTPGLSHFVNMFTKKIENLVARIVAKEKPAKIFICMIYYLDEKPGDGWADNVLAMMGYNRNPAKLQYIISLIFEKMRAYNYNIPGSEVVIVPLFEALNGKNTDDYLQRVEPR